MLQGPAILTTDAPASHGKRLEDALAKQRRRFHYQGWGVIQVAKVTLEYTDQFGPWWLITWELAGKGEAVYKCTICRDSGFLPGSGSLDEAAEECDCQDRDHPYLAFDWQRWADHVDNESERF